MVLLSSFFTILLFLPFRMRIFTLSHVCWKYLIFFFFFLFLQVLTVKEFAFSFRGDFGLRHPSSAGTVKTLITLNTKCVLHKEMDIRLLGTRI